MYVKKMCCPIQIRESGKLTGTCRTHFKLRNALMHWAGTTDMKHEKNHLVALINTIRITLNGLELDHETSHSQ